MFTPGRATFVSLLGCLWWFVAASVAHGAENCTYFVDAIAGNDANPGTSASQAWRTLWKVSDSSGNFQGGDVICFHRGQRFYNLTIGTVSNSGVDGNPIVFTSYGGPELPRPVLSNARRIDQDSGWTDLGNNRYHYAYVGCYMPFLWENGVPLKRATTPDLEDGDWYFQTFQSYADCDPNMGMYYRPTSGVFGDKPLFMANNAALFTIHDRSYLTFEDLAFEFTGNVLWGRANTTPIHHITVQNNTFTSIASPISLASQTVDGVPHENHDIVIDGNTFDNIRFAVVMGGNDVNNGVVTAHTMTRTYNVTVANNTVRNVAIDGAYTLASTSPDIEVFSFQNLRDSVISNNDVRNGLKQSQGLFSADGDPLVSVGVVMWVHLNQTIENVRIERNRFDNIGWGVAIGASPTYRLVNDTIANNIISNCELGVRLNAGDSGAGGSVTGVFHNTFFRNNINMYLNSGALNYQIKNNLSIEPRDYHMWMQESGGLSSVLDHNLYVPDAPFFYKRTNTTYSNLSAWQAGTVQLGSAQDVHSSTANSANFVSAVPVEADDFQLDKNSPAIDAGTVVAQVAGDFAGRSRGWGMAPDIGAWEADTTDLLITMSDTPDPVLPNDTVTYTITVTNNGPSAATNVTATGTLPACDLGTIISGASAGCVRSVTASSAGTLNQSMNVSATEYDPDLANNNASTTSSVLGSCTGSTGPKIAGKVTRSNGTAIPGVILTLIRTSAPQCGNRVTTPNNGNYQFSKLASGTYTVTPSKSGCSGFTPGSRTVILTGGNQTNQNFTGACP
jgi:hypothetical protein